MVLHSSFLRMLAAALVVILLSACSTPAAKLEPTAPPVMQPTATAVAAAARTPFPTETPRHTPLPEFTATSLPTQTAAPTETPAPAFNDIKLIGLGWMENYQMLLSFQFSGPISPDDYRVMMENHEYACEVIAQYPDRLYCTGPGAKVLRNAWVRVYPANSQQPEFEKEVYVPYFDNDYKNNFQGPY